MEILSPQAIAAQIGAPTKNLRGTQDWCPALHPGMVISELHYAEDGGVIPYRVRDGGVVIASKLDDENAPDNVDAIFTDAMVITQKVELELKPALYAAIPDLNPASEAIVRGLSMGGKEMIGDLVGGQIVNIREPAALPIVSVDDGGKLQVDTSMLNPLNKAAAELAIEAIVKSAPVLEAISAIKG